MLVFTREAGQTVRIGDDVTIQIVRINKDQIRIGIEAPIDVAVHRGEVYDRIQAGEPRRPKQGKT